MRYFIVFCAAGLLAFTGDVWAEPLPDSPDCDAIKTTLIPYQIKLIKEHSVWRGLYTIQVARDSSGFDAMVARVTSTASYKLKSITRNGSRIASDRQYFRGESNSRIDHFAYEYEGLDPKQADYRIDQTFAFKEKFENIDGKDKEFIRSYDVSYKYRKTENISIGSCVFIAHLGESTITDKKSHRVSKSFSWHFPDLRLLVGNPTPDVTFQSINTAFEPIDLADPNWPAPSKADNH